MLNKILAFAVCAAMPFTLVQAESDSNSDSSFNAARHLHYLALSTASGTLAQELELNSTPQALSYPVIVFQQGHKDKVDAAGNIITLNGGHPGDLANYLITFTQQFESSLPDQEVNLFVSLGGFISAPITVTLVDGLNLISGTLPLGSVPKGTTLQIFATTTVGTGTVTALQGTLIVNRTN